MQFFRNIAVSASIALALTINAFANEASTLDLQKFENEAKAYIQAEFGNDSLKPGSGSILFQDGASSTDSSPLIDLASVNYVVEMKSGLLPAEYFRLSYRLSLNNGATSLMLTRTPDNNQSLFFYSAQAGTVVYKQDASKPERQQLIREILTVAPNAKITDFPAGVAALEKPKKHADKNGYPSTRPLDS
jgi:hypothetical protein